MIEMKNWYAKHRTTVARWASVVFVVGLLAWLSHWFGHHPQASHPPVRMIPRG